MLHNGHASHRPQNTPHLLGKAPAGRVPLRAWHSAVSKAEWATTADIREMSRSADFVADNRVIFNIGGNKYRLSVHVSYEYKRVLIKFIGTHREYDKINPETV